MHQTQMLRRLVFLVLMALVWGLSHDAQSPKTNLNSLQFPDDSLVSNPGSIYPLTPGLVPSPRVKGTVTYVEPLVIVMGGYNTDGTFMDDIHFYDTRLRKWSGVILKRGCCHYDGPSGKVVERSGATEETGPGAKAGFEGDLPAARAEHAACAYNGLLYIFGGATSHYGLTNDMYSYDPVELQWKLINRYGGQGPTRRAGHNFVADAEKGQLALFGGRASIAGRVVGLADVWIFDVQARKWEWASMTAGLSTEPNPAGRQHAAATIVHSTLFVVGGQDPSSDLLFNDVWAFDLGQKKWTQIAANSGHTSGFAPPPLHHSTLIPVIDRAGPNATNFQHASLLLYGGVGGGGACGGAACGLAETSLGQVYRLPIAFDLYNLDNSGGPTSQAPPRQPNANSGLQGMAGVGWDGASSVMDVTTWRLSLSDSHWSYARLSDASDDAMLHGRPNARGIPGAAGPGGGGALGRGRLLKSWALEAACYDPVRSLFYELGGIQVVPIELQKANQKAVELTGPTLLDTGNTYTGRGDSTGVAGLNPPHATDAPLWDLETQEHLRTTMQLPVNSPWQFSDAFHSKQPQNNATLRFLHTFRTYHISNFENVVLQITDHQGTIP